MNKQEEVYGCNKQNVDRVFINVGGTRHECFIKTLQNFPDTRLYWIAEMAIKMANFGEDVDEFFFDRHPGCFQNILNYCRTGKLHCPKDVCGPVFAEELAFWGVDELMMQPCCWPNYSEFNDASKNLKAFHDSPMDHYHYKKKKVHKLGSEQIKNCSKKKKFYKLKRAIWNLTEIPQKNWLTKVVASIQIFTTLLSILTFCLATEPKLKNKYDIVFNYFERSYCLIFTVDLVLKILCCPSFLKLLKDFLIWVDVVSLLPFYFELLSNNEKNEFLQSLRLLRIFRILRFFRNLRGMVMMTVFGETLRASFEPLMLLGLVLFIPMVLFAAMVYYAEKHFSSNSQFKSIPKSCWWAIITLTTVGYGDIIPSSVVGKIVGVFCATFGVLVVALPISVIGNNFTFYYSYAKASMKLPKNRNKLLIDQDILNLNEKSNDHNSKSRRYGLPSLFFDSPTVNTKLQEELSKSILLPKILLSPHSDTNNEREAAFRQTKDNTLKGFAETNSGIHKNHKKTSLNKIINSSFYLTNNFENNLMNNENKENLKRSYSNVNEPIPFMLPFNISNDSCSSSQISLKSTSEDRRKVIHADITQYVPRKLSSRVRAEICRKLNLEYNNNY